MFSPRRRLAAVLASGLTAAALGGAVLTGAATPAEAAPKNPWTQVGTKRTEWGNGRYFVVTQWQHKSYPGWTYVQADHRGIPTMMQVGRDGSVTSQISQRAQIACRFADRGRVTGTSTGERASGSWWTRSGPPSTCTAAPNDGSSPVAVSISIPRTGQRAMNVR
ncbi:MAG: hypothetical protein Q4G34_01035 [Micrococcus sp.]|nr:hypothetical protein [Micrococcus sp.]